MQNTGWANFATFHTGHLWKINIQSVVIWSGLEKSFTYACDHLLAVDSHFSIVTKKNNSRNLAYNYVAYSLRSSQRDYYLYLSGLPYVGYIVMIGLG